MAKINLQNLIDCESEIIQIVVIRTLSQDIATVELDETELLSVSFNGTDLILGECDEYGVLAVDNDKLSIAIDFIRAIGGREFKAEIRDEVAGYGSQTVVCFNI